MSAIATFIEVPLSEIPGLLRASEEEDHIDLRRFGNEIIEFEGSGWIFGTLLCFLEDRHIDLLASDYSDLVQRLTEDGSAAVFPLTFTHASKYLDALAQQRFGEDELRRYYNEFNETDWADSGKIMRYGIAALIKALASVKPDRVVFLQIG